MTLFVGVDPDTEAPAWAAVRDGKLLAVDFIDVIQNERDLARARAITIAEIGIELFVNRITALRQWSDEIVVLCVESQYVNKRTIAEDILTLAHVAGCVSGAASFLKARLVMPKPAEWKGGLKKETHHPRIIEKVGRAAIEARTADLTQERRLDALDAVGLAWWIYEGGKQVVKFRKPKKKDRPPTAWDSHPKRDRAA